MNERALNDDAQNMVARHKYRNNGIEDGDKKDCVLQTPNDNPNIVHI